MSENLRNGLRLFVKIIIVNVLSAIVVLSVMALSMSAFADEIGYDIYGTKGDSGETQLLYRHLHEDGEDTRLEEYKAEGYAITKKLIKQTNKTEHNITVIIAQIFALGVTVSYIYPPMWDRGYKDSALVKADNLPEDKFRGLKIGLIAQIPAYMLLGLFLIFSKLPAAVFKLLNSSLYTLFEFTFQSSNTFAQLNFLQILLTALILLIIPLIAWGAYELGYRDIAIAEKLTYKKKEEN